MNDLISEFILKSILGFTFGTFVVDQKYYMKFLMDNLKREGVQFIQKRVENVHTLVESGEFDCVVNCTGLGALTAASDSSMYPIRGQVMRVRYNLRFHARFFRP